MNPKACWLWDFLCLKGVKENEVKKGCHSRILSLISMNGCTAMKLRYVLVLRYDRIKY
ncbi:MAG: hypothetical protein WCD89_16980 [Anaerocolumna sp.]